MKGTHDKTKGEVSPTMAHLTDPYVLQLVEALADMGDEVVELERKYKQCSRAFDDLEAASGAWEAAANSYKDMANENQRVAGRYQYLHEQAMKTLNKIDDLFEYQYTAMTPDQIKKTVYVALSHFTAEVSKLITKNKK